MNYELKIPSRRFYQWQLEGTAVPGDKESQFKFSMQMSLNFPTNCSSMSSSSSSLFFPLCYGGQREKKWKNNCGCNSLQFSARREKLACQMWDSHKCKAALKLLRSRREGEFKYVLTSYKQTVAYRYLLLKTKTHVCDTWKNLNFPLHVRHLETLFGHSEKFNLTELNLKLIYWQERGDDCA